MTELRMLIVALAVRAHQLETGMLPENLESLVPEYLPAVPDDPFGQGPFQYHGLGKDYRLYSVRPGGVRLSSAEVFSPPPSPKAVSADKPGGATNDAER
jgi:hypothetical protein